MNDIVAQIHPLRCRFGSDPNDLDFLRYVIFAEGWYRFEFGEDSAHS